MYLDQERIKMIKDKYTEFTSGQGSGRTEVREMKSMGNNSTLAAGGMGSTATSVTHIG